jgi:hypothetical protein
MFLKDSIAVLIAGAAERPRKEQPAGAHGRQGGHFQTWFLGRGGRSSLRSFVVGKAAARCRGQ